MYDTTTTNVSALPKWRPLNQIWYVKLVEILVVIQKLVISAVLDMFWSTENVSKAVWVPSII